MENHKLNDKYNPKEFEKQIYSNWEKNGYFKPDMNLSKESYCIVMPPPNVTGKLHMGHALDGTIQDILIRYKRMNGFNTLWVPGTDHSAISTEVKVVEKLKQEGRKKSDLTRKQFLEEAWAWTHLYGGQIENQQRRLGCSCDWSRKRFTMDEGLSNAVYEAFKRMYEKGYIYKGKRMINFCTGCKSSISDAEIEYKQEQTHLWYIKYKIKDEDSYLTVATTRPETMLGDTAVAVNPNDGRYKKYIGKTCILPLMNKEIPIIADRFVETEFGTGAVKITPCHDMNDYQAGIEHNLDMIEVFDENLNMNHLIPELEGMDIYEARKVIVNKLQEIEALEKIEDYTHNVARCDRCHSIIEPRISDQWFLKISELAKPAVKAVKNGDIKFVPERYDKTYFNWMENLKDWCISRQIWWGHQIPVYYCQKCEEIVVEKEMPSKCPKCGEVNLIQDTDTLDTWFSSALWPFSTLGWPNNQSVHLKTFYPTDTLVTGYDIIQAWVSRMIFSAIEYMGEKPFDNVLIHGIVRDSQGRKMSKSLGNGIDPLEIIEKYGTDSLRFSLIMGITPGNDIRYMPEKLDAASNFANKLWNASKFVLMNLEDYNGEEVKDGLCYEDKWILAKLNKLIKEVTNNLDNFDLGVAVAKIYDFIWNEFCDWYIEIVKTRLYDKECKTRLAVKFVLNKVLTNSLKLLHPFMPFITEEIYMKLYNIDKSIIISKWPKYEKEDIFQFDEIQIEKIKAIITGIRNIRTNMNVHPSKKANVIFVTQKYKNLIKESEAFLERLCFASNILIQENTENIPQNAVSILENELDVFIPFEDLVDLQVEKERLQNEKVKLESEVVRSTKMLNNPGFINKAPASKLAEEKEKLVKYEELLNSVIERLAKI